MNKKAAFILITAAILSQGCHSEKNGNRHSGLSEEAFEEVYPWRESTTRAAVEAINTSIKNQLSDQASRDKNFPADPGPYNVAFNQTEIEEFAIVGYSHSESSPELYEIEFRPARIDCCTNRITVRIDIRTNEVFMVFMKPDA